MTVTALENSIVRQAMSSQESHGRRQAAANTQLSSGRAAVKASNKPSDQALAAQMDALNRVIDQASLNAKNLSSVIQLATKTLTNMRNTLATMDALAAQSRAGELTDKDRVSIHNVMVELRNGLQTAAATAEFNGTQLFTGGAGTVTIAEPSTVSGTNAASTNFISAFAPGANVAETQGYVSGETSNASVRSNGVNSFDFQVDIGEQTFVAHSVRPRANETLKLVSESNPENIYAMNFGTVVSYINHTTDLDNLELTWPQAMKTAPGFANAVMTSLATAPSNGLVEISASSTAQAGEYAVTYAAGSNELKIQNARGESFSATVATTGEAQAVTFTNGLTVNLDATFDAAAEITQVIVDVDQSNQISFTSQTGAYSDDTTTVDFAGATADLLGTASLKISNISLLTFEDAEKASESIKAAMDSISTMYGNLGAAMGNLELKANVLADTSNELRNAISGYRDADIPQAIAEEKIAASAEEMAGNAIGKALNKNQLLLKIAQQA